MNSTLIKLLVWKLLTLIRKHCTPTLYIVITSLFASISIKLLTCNNVELLLVDFKLELLVNTNINLSLKNFEI